MNLYSAYRLGKTSNVQGMKSFQLHLPVSACLMPLWV